MKEFVLAMPGATASDVSSIGVIEANPDQSKHLETATMRIFGSEIDFVNLRSEKYTEGSRIPTMEFGSAMEDAMRRDFTINSLFYNTETVSSKIDRHGVSRSSQRAHSDANATLADVP